jgi:hypothetical protein
MDGEIPRALAQIAADLLSKDPDIPGRRRRRQVGGRADGDP